MDDIILVFMTRIQKLILFLTITTFFNVFINAQKRVFADGITILALGDSITSGGHGANFDGESYLCDLRDMITPTPTFNGSLSNFSGCGVGNFAYPGWTSTQMLSAA